MKRHRAEDPTTEESVEDSTTEESVLVDKIAAVTTVTSNVLDDVESRVGHSVVLGHTHTVAFNVPSTITPSLKLTSSPTTTDVSKRIGAWKFDDDKDSLKDLSQNVFRNEFVHLFDGLVVNDWKDIRRFNTFMLLLSENLDPKAEINARVEQLPRIDLHSAHPS